MLKVQHIVFEISSRFRLRDTDVSVHGVFTSRAIRARPPVGGGGAFLYPGWLSIPKHPWEPVVTEPDNLNAAEEIMQAKYGT